MNPEDKQETAGLHYQADEKPPLSVAFNLGLQLAVLHLSVTILITTLAMRAAEQAESFVAWAVFAAVAISGVSIILQSCRFGRFGMGHMLMMGSSVVFVPVCIIALTMGGPELMATLIVVSSLFQFVISERLSLFRRVLTPAVSGTVLMLIPISVMPTVFHLLTDVPEGSPHLGGPLSALVTVLLICGITLAAKGSLRLWAPIIGAITGSLVAGFFGLYDTARVTEAGWLGYPRFEWPGLDLEFDSQFWALLPGFLLAAIIGSIRTISSAAAMQRISWRRTRVMDFQGVQSAVATDGLSNLLSGFAGTIPNTAYSTGASLAQLTGVAARHVGIAAGVMILLMAFFPKAVALVLAMPGPVFSAYLVVLISMLFTVGLKMVTQGGMDYRKGLIVGVSFWIGTGFQGGAIYPEFFSEFAGGFLNNGVTAGGLVVILMTFFVEMLEPRPKRFKTSLELSALPRLRGFLDKCVSESDWHISITDRLTAACEEILLMLLREERDEGQDRPRTLNLLVRKKGNRAVLEFITRAGGSENIQEKVLSLGELIDGEPIEREISPRLLEHHAVSVQHQQYHGLDIVTVHVEFP